MFCPKCGVQNEDSARACVRCGTAWDGQPYARPPQGAIPAPQVVPQRVPSYLAQAILLTLFCCPPLGIPAIVYGAQVNDKLAISDYQGAMIASNKAKMWCWISFGLGLAFQLAFAILTAVVMLSGMK